MVSGGCVVVGMGATGRAVVRTAAFLSLARLASTPMAYCRSSSCRPTNGPRPPASSSSGIRHAAAIGARDAGERGRVGDTGIGDGDSNATDGGDVPGSDDTFSSTCSAAKPSGTGRPRTMTRRNPAECARDDSCRRAVASCAVARWRPKSAAARSGGGGCWAAYAKSSTAASGPTLSQNGALWTGASSRTMSSHRLAARTGAAEEDSHRACARRA